MSAALKPGSSLYTGGVNFTTAPCRYGAVLVAANDQGICDIHLGTSQYALTVSYRQSVKDAVNSVDGDEQPPWLADVLKLAEDPTYTLDYPLDIQGTPFQTAVWKALCDVPTGQTTTYSELAAAIGMPKAYRAVGAACGANRLALAIPCHRVLRKGRRPLDYRWGTAVKRQILTAEAAWMFDSLATNL